MSSDRLLDPSRRNIVKAAAWTTPVVATAVAAPLAAASPPDPGCPEGGYQYQLQWAEAVFSNPDPGMDDHILGAIAKNGRTAVVVAHSINGGPDITLTAHSERIDVPFTNPTASTRNHSVTTNYRSGSSNLQIANIQRFLSAGGGFNTLFTFSSPVKDLTFSVEGINAPTPVQLAWENVTLTPGFTTSSITHDPVAPLLGDGSPGSPWTPSARNPAAPNNNQLSSVEVVYPDVTSFQLSIWNSHQYSVTDMYIYVSGMTFSTPC